VITIAGIDRPERLLFGTEVAEVVARGQHDPVGSCTLLERGDARHHIEEIPRLQEHGRAIRRTTERRRDLHLPRRDAACAKLVVERLEITMVETVQVDVRCRRDPGGAQAIERRHRRAPAAAQVTHAIVRRFEPVDRHRRVREPDARQLGCELGGDATPTRRQRRSDPAIAKRADDRREAVVQVRFAADQHDFARTHRRELVDHDERLVRRQFPLSRHTGARATMRARVIAAERQLPHDVGGKRLGVDDVQSPTFAAGHAVPRGAKISSPSSPNRRSLISTTVGGRAYRVLTPSQTPVRKKLARACRSVIWL